MSIEDPGTSIAARPGPAAPHSRLGRLLKRVSPFSTVTLGLGVLIGLVALVPLLRVIARLFFGPDGFTLHAISSTIALPGFGRLILNTFLVVVGSAILAMIFGVFLAWLNERTDARLGIVTDSLPLIPFLLPPIAGAIGWVLLLSERAGFLNVALRAAASALGVQWDQGPLNIYSWPGLILVYTLYQIPYAFLMISSGLRNADASLDEQSRVCGFGPLQTLVRVTIPSIRQNVGGAWFLLMLQGFSLFSIPVIIGTGAHIDILSVRVVNLLTAKYPPDIEPAVGLSIIVVLFVAIFWYAQIRLLRDFRRSTMTGRNSASSVLHLGHLRWLARTLMFGYGVVSVVLPTAALAIVTLQGFWTPNINWRSLSITHFVDTIFGSGMSSQAIANSLYVSAIGATIAIVLATLFALYVRRSAGVSKYLLDSATKLPSVFPHLILAVGFILTFVGEPFNLGGTLWILVIAYISLYLPQGAVAIDSALSQVSDSLPEAASVSGAGQGRVFRTVYLPLVTSGLVAGWTFVFARMMGDLTATALLAGPSNEVVGFRILEIFSNGTFAELAAIGIALTMVTSVVVIGGLAVERYSAKWRGGRA